jgi:hypothetical protein
MKSKFELDKEQKKELGKFLIDVAKLIFGGVVLARILKESTSTLSVMFFGLFIIALLVFSGLILLKEKK